jgi:nitroreductase
METRSAIASKRDTRVFSERPIAPETIERMVQAARMAGSARAAEPVRLILLADAEQKARLAACGNATGHVVSAPLAVAFILVPEFGAVGAPFTIFRGPFDSGRAAQNMMLAAWDEGISSCPASMHDGEAARLVLGVPEGHIVANVIAFGYPGGADPMTGTRPRMPSADFAHWERWPTG